MTRYKSVAVPSIPKIYDHTHTHRGCLPEMVQFGSKGIKHGLPKHQDQGSG
jgi:hypothetical protein